MRWEPQIWDWIKTLIFGIKFVPPEQSHQEIDRKIFALEAERRGYFHIIRNSEITDNLLNLLDFRKSITNVHTRTW